MTIDITVKTDVQTSAMFHNNGTAYLTAIVVRSSFTSPNVNINVIGKRGRELIGGLTINTRAFAKLCHKFLAAYIAGGGTFDDLKKE
jgi:hypothetical protein